MRKGERGWGAGWGLLVLGVVGVLGADAPALAAEDTQAKIAEVTAKAQAVTSYQADFALTVTEEDRPTTLKGTIWYQGPDKRRIEFETAELAEEIAQLVISNGAFEWQYFPVRKLVYQTEWAKVKAGGAPVGALELRGLHQPFIDVKPETIRLVKTKAEGRHPLYLFEAEPVAALVADAPFLPGTVRIEVSGRDGLTRRLAMTDAEGREVLVQQYSAVQVNIPVEGSRFAFTMPSGVQVVDISEERTRAARPSQPEEGGEAP